MKSGFYVLIAILFITISACTIQKSQNSKSNKQHLTFPEDWLGAYWGELEWYQGSKLNAKIPICLEIFKNKENPEEIIWRTTYDSTAALPYKVVKDYAIIHPDSLESGHFLMDEKNGIYLDMRLTGNSMYSCFDVITKGKEGSNRLVSIDRLVNKNQLYHEIISYPQPVNKSGDIGDSEGYTILSTKEISTQKATLTRVKK